LYIIAMPYKGLSEFISDLEKHLELHRIKTFADPVLEITEITDRITKNNGKALLFENTGTDFPVLINAYGSDKRMAMSLGRDNLDNTTDEILTFFGMLTKTSGKILGSLSSLVKVSRYLPSRISRKGTCQEIITMDPDLDMLPVLKCWPHDGGRFITLPIVHTMHPATGKTNAGMYRMQILDKKSTAMHWQLHKTGANHFEAWKKAGRKMPVSVTLGGDPAYAYSATAPLPENIDEYILAGFLRKKRVKLVKCITNDLYVPYDADIVIEGYVDPSEKPVWEGPFGDHTGFYSLADWYPRFHVTCITHSRKAVYPATVVGIPPHEDAWLIKATEKIFLAPVKLVIQPEIEDFHMPPAGVAHNLVVVKINKIYPGQGKKVISSMFGTGQMMFTKYLLVVSGEIDIRDYRALLYHVLENTDFKTDLIYTSGPLDVLDHSSDAFAMGGKLGIDGTIKLEQELHSGDAVLQKVTLSDEDTGRLKQKILDLNCIVSIPDNLPVAVVGINQDEPMISIEKSRKFFRDHELKDKFRMILAVDHTVDVNDMFMVAWQILGNSDPQRDIETISDNSLFIDGTIKVFHGHGFPRRWPNVVCSDMDTINKIDKKWGSLGYGAFLPSPSLKISRLLREGSDEVIERKT
jgi:4-hydroxy-3-polyprenylbenzoate decarboxylase